MRKCLGSSLAALVSMAMDVKVAASDLEEAAFKLLMNKLEHHKVSWFVLTSRAPVGSPGLSQTSLAPIGSAGLSCHHRVMRWGYNARTRVFLCTRVLARAPGLPNVPGPHGAHLGVPCVPFE